MSDPDKTGVYEPDDQQSPRFVDAAAVPSHIGRYRVDKVLGKGSFGLVYLAHDDQLSRPVAIKVPHAKLISRPEDAEAYLLEARTVASLDHPHIVAVYDVGSTEQFPCYVVSKYIDGTDLSLRLTVSRLDLHDAVELVATVAEALHYAHKRGLVHRDIKPGNILIDKNGSPVVADFGLALREQDMGQGPRYVGTPAYMSPEQARGEGHRVDGRSDIFSLAVVLYELLVGRRPFIGKNSIELLEAITKHDPKPPRQIDDNIPKELDRICLKALSKRATERYSTAKDMADDLRHFLTHHSGSATSVVSPSLTPVVQPPSTLTGSDTPSGAISDSKPIRIVPKGLRSFDAHDSDFFLELLPGPRDRDGLPDSLRFWKTRIEETDADNTFSVGLIYGPSGCGKSSLVKAGLLPRLSDYVIAVYVEATADDTEARLLNGLRKRYPVLPDKLPLKETLAVLRRGHGKKVVIILDQFEQWLHAKKEEQNTELVEALRQCDGGHLQCIVMVRDDFWMAATRFMRELEVKLLEGQNSAAVDLFDLEHAKRVLAAFGRAFGKLPENGGDTSKDEKEFLKRAVSDLAQEGKVISVRLALFAEMMKGKPWTPATLKEVGGTEGVGVTFLEETFSAATAPPEHRYHQKAARAILKSLLPEAGTDIKGHMRSRDELLEASGYRSHPKDFDDLIRILDSEIRLITPTDPEGQEERSASSLESGKKYYQLTHDYLVPSLRDWLTRKQKETRRGRAELLLTDRAGVWNARPENRQLPSLMQWLQIRWWTTKKNWTAPQRKMMSRARKYHSLRGMLVGLILTVIGLGSWEGHGQLEGRQLRKRLLESTTTAVPGIVREMASYRRWVNPILRDAHNQAEKENHPQKQLHTSLALLPTDPNQVDYLYERLITAEPHEVVVIREALIPHKNDLTEKLWKLLENPKNDQDQRFRAACALATLAPDDGRWENVSGGVAAMLVVQKPFVIAQWTDAFNEAGRWLIPTLADYLVERRIVSERGLAASIYGHYTANNPEARVRLEKHLAETTEPHASVELKDALAKRRASIGVALLIMGYDEKVWPLLKHSPDPTMRSYLIDYFQKMGVDPKLLAARLEMEEEVSIKRALLLSLGEYGPDRLSVDIRLKLLPQLLQFCRDDPDPGIHGTAEWLLREWGEALPELPVGEPVLTEEQEARNAKLTAEVENIRQRISVSEKELPVRQAAWEQRLREQASALPASLSNGLIVHYPFDETSGMQAFNSVQGQSSGLYAGSGEPRWESGVVGHAVRLNGTGHFDGGEAFHPERTDSFSCGCWFLANTTNENENGLMGLFGKFDGQKGFAAYLDRTMNQIVCVWQNNDVESLTVVSETSVLAGRWHYLFLTYDGSSSAAGVTVYLDGRAIPARSKSHNLSDSIQTSATLQIGNCNISQSFKGAIDDVRLYNRRISEAEVRHLFQSSLRALALVPPEKRTSEQQVFLAETYRSHDGLLQRLEQQFAEQDSVRHAARWNGIRQWYVNRQGQTMVVVLKPGEFWMGYWEQLQRSGINYSFAIASKEVTVEQFLRFRSENENNIHASRTGGCPVNSPSWYEAAEYCNWLSRQEGIPKGQWCYEPNEDGKYKEGMAIPADFLRRTGYRLPSEVEWEYACRAKAETLYSFGDSEELLANYCWYMANSLSYSHPVGTLRPNELGLFDMHGNIREWGHNDYWESKANQDQSEVVKDEVARPLRGGSFLEQPGDWSKHVSAVASAHRGFDQPNARNFNVGFRVARTLPPVPLTALPTPEGGEIEK